MILLCFLSIGVLFPGLAQAVDDDVEKARYRVEHLAGIWQRGYLDGPAKGSMFDGWNATADIQGNVYVMDITRVRVISREGRVWTIAGNGIRGFRDGLADEAMFNIGGRGYDYANIALDSKGNIYIPDGFNNRIRKIFRKPDGLWWVETWAGGGGKSLKPGDSGKALDIKITNPLSLAVDAYDNVWTEGYCCIYKITPLGEVISYKNVVGKVVNMQADSVGNVYLQGRDAWAALYWKINQNGVISKVAGLSDNKIKQLKKQGKPVPVDGLAEQASFWSHKTLAVSPDGNVIYGGNGDEHVIRRIKEGRVTSLFKEGWKTERSERGSGWFLGGPLFVDQEGRIIILGNNPPQFLRFRLLIPEK
jgi:hypothetical protein